MSNQLQTNLDAILLDKNTNLKPENLRTGITCLGIEGTMDAGAMTNADYQTCLQLADDIMGNPAPAEGHIYGVKRLRSSVVTAWERTDEGRGLTANATKDGTEVQNDFDNLSPWKDIISFNYDSAQQLATAYYGDDNFTFSPSDANVNVFTKIPQFWYKVDRRMEKKEMLIILLISIVLAVAISWMIQWHGGMSDQRWLHPGNFGL